MRHIRNKTFKAFTLVELIIVITILAILATIAFVSFQGYVKDSRDSTRLTTLKNIESGLQTFQVNTGNYPEPENYTLIQASGTTISYQGYVGDSIAKQIKMSKTPLDPLDQMRFLYAVSGNKTKYQLLGYAEKQITYLPSAFADNYGQRTPKIIGNPVGIFLDNQNISISGAMIDILKSNSGTLYKVYFGDSEIAYLSGNLLYSNIYNRRTDLLQNKNLAKLDDTLVLYYDMESLVSSGSDYLLQDLSKYGNNGKCYNGEVGGTCKSLQRVVGNISSIYLDGIGDWISVPNTFFLTLPTEDFTIVSLFKTTQYANQRCIVSTSGNGGTGFRYGYSGNYHYYLYGGFSEGLVQSGIILNDGTKHYLASQYFLGKKITSYIDGNYYGDLDISSFNFGNKGALNQSQYFSIGTMNAGGASINAELYTIKLYNRALSDSEIKEIYNSIK